MMSSPLVPPPTGRLGLVEFVEPAVCEVLHERVGVDLGMLRTAISLTDDLALDSLDMLEVVIDLESAFAIVVPEREIDRVRSVGDLVRVVAKYVWERDHPEPFEPIQIQTAA
jgi:acyl carrier protein